jgi:hypothetical protein
VQSVPITTKVVSSNPAHSEVYSILLYVIKFVNDLRQVLWFYPTIELTVTIYITVPTGATSRAGTAYHSRALFCVVFCESLHACPLFVFLVWSLYFLSFNLRFLITPFFTFKLFLHNNEYLFH